ncbi:hypothetical protein BGZ63DRAFT_428811 [Mariannaea sp. PMI_226]|nr:hypothetical protein BGZ63DRAFT_428811 [Mariannaea sp. PMI_226]
MQQAVGAVTLGLAVMSHALPHVSHPGDNLFVRDGPADKCPETIPAQGDDSFAKSGAQQWLSDYLTDSTKNAWADGNWLHKLDVETTGSGNFQGGVFDCSAIDGSSCKATDVDCKKFTPPEMWWVRQAAVGAHDFFTQAHEQLQDGVISADLGTDQMVTDLDVSGNMQQDFGGLIAAILFAIGTIVPFANIGLQGLGVSASIISRSTTAATAAGALGGGTNLRNNIATLGNTAVPKTPFELATAAQNVLKGFFDTVRNDLQLTLHQIFAGVGQGEPDKVAALQDALKKNGAPDDNVHPVAYVLSHGGFLKPTDSNGLKNILDAGLNVVKHQMVGAILAAQQVVVFQNTNGEQKWCDQIRGSRWFEDSCWTLSHLKIDPRGMVEAEDLSEDTMVKIENYGIDVQQLYENVRDCGNDFRTPSADLTYNGPYPRCAFGLSHFKANDQPCNFWPGTKGIAFQNCYCSNKELDCIPQEHRDWWASYSSGGDVKYNGWYD